MRIKDKRFVFLSLLVFVIGVSYFSISFYMNDGDFTLPVDDSYIYLQYAKQFAKGNPFKYQPNDDFSTGATSLLYLFILVPFAFIFSAKALEIFVFFLGFLFFGFSSIIFMKILDRYTSDKTLSFLGSLFFVLSGSISWGYMSGMEIFLTSTLLLLLLYFQDDKKRLIILSLLSLTRPEFVILNLCFVFLIKNKKKILIPLLISFLYFVLNFILTGRFSPTGSSSKLFFLRSNFLKSITFTATLYFGDVFKGILGGFYPNDVSVGFDGVMVARYFAPLSLLLFVFGIKNLLRNQRVDVAVSVFSFIIIYVLGISFSTAYGFQNHRYLIPIFVVYSLILTLGILEIGKLRYFVLSFLLIFNLLGTIHFRGIFGINSYLIGAVFKKMAYWLKENVKDDEAIALVDAGSLKYFSQKRIIDMLGLVSPKYYGLNFAEVFEQMKKEKNKPNYILIQRSFCQKSGDYMQIYILVDTPVHAINLLSGLELTLWRVKKCFFENYPEVNGKIIFSLNIADKFDEKNKKVKFYFKEPEIVVYPFVYKNDTFKFADGGRIVYGAIEFKFYLDTLKENLYLILGIPKSVDFGVGSLYSAKITRWEKDKFKIKIELNSNIWEKEVFLNRGYNFVEIQIKKEFLQKGENFIRLYGFFPLTYLWIVEK